MTPATFEARWAHDLAHAEKTLLADGHLAPLFIIIGADGRSTVVPAIFSDQETKAHFFNLARLTAIAEDAEAVLIRTEAWAVVGDDLAVGLSPSQSDRRIEVVSVAATARYGKKVIHRLSMREILRADDGQPVGLREVSVPEGGDEAIRGEMFDLLPPRRPSRDERAMAKTLLEVMKERAGA